MIKIYLLPTDHECDPLNLLRHKNYADFMTITETEGTIYSVAGFNELRPDINGKTIYINNTERKLELCKK